MTVPIQATDLYISPLFKKSKIYTESRGRWFILPALHGLLAHKSITAPYDVTIKKMRAAARREWGQKVRHQMEAVGLLGLPLVALAGDDYTKPLVSAGVQVEKPMQGLGIGLQLQWLDKQNAQITAR